MSSSSSSSSSHRAAVDALLTEHFRYTPLSLIDDIINTVNAIVYRALGAVETGLLNTPPATLGYVADPGSDADPARRGEVGNGTLNGESNGGVQLPREAEEVARAEIENGVHQLETLLEATVDKKFDIFELYALRYILNVEEGLVDWVRLGHYEVCLDWGSVSYSTRQGVRDGSGDRDADADADVATGIGEFDRLC